jgi:hypothetical protein
MHDDAIAANAITGIHIATAGEVSFRNHSSRVVERFVRVSRATR